MTDLEDSPTGPNGIANITVSGSQLTVVLDDATSRGPFTIPRIPFRPSIVATVAAATYTPVIGDANGYIRCTNAAGCVVTIPLNADVAFSVDTEITFRQVGAGAVSFQAATGALTLNPPIGFLSETAVQHATVTLKKVAEDEWDIIGLLAEDVTA